MTDLENRAQKELEAAIQIMRHACDEATRAAATPHSTQAAKCRQVLQFIASGFVNATCSVSFAMLLVEAAVGGDHHV